LILRLVQLQLVRGSAYRQLADQNRLRLVPEPAPRGQIVDRQGRVLATNDTVFRVALVPQDLQDLPSVLSRVSAVVHRSPDVLQAAFRREQGVAFMPATLVSRVPKDAAIRLEEERWRLPGLLVKPESARAYPLGSTAGPLLGYLSEPTAEEFPVLKRYGIRPKERVGRAGLEQALDHALRGRSGGLVVEVDHRGRQVRVVSHRSPEPGAQVRLTLDANLQTLIERSFGSQPGAAVVLDPGTGEVLAMVSVPSFAPETFLSSEPDEIRRLLNDPGTPLMNRATVGVYQPGSILKPITAAAALEQKLISPSTTILCGGVMTIGNRPFRCWYRDGHGPMSLRDALMQSCNVYFMSLGRKLGQARLQAALGHVGFSRRTGWPLDEQAGYLPQRRLTEGEVALLAMGQGEVLITPLQAAVVVSAFANGGRLVEPWIVRAVADRPLGPKTKPRRLDPHSGPRTPLGVRDVAPPWGVELGAPGLLGGLHWSAETIRAVRAGMLAVVRDPSGTGHRAFSPLVSIAGKTGTAETHRPGRTHGWFVGFCPADAPRAALAIVAEFGGSGGDLPADIAKAICEAVTAKAR